jgi:hypothetical protein
MGGTYEVALFSLGILVAFLILLAFFGFSIWLSRRSAGISPFSGLPLRRGSDLSFAAKEKIYRMLFDMHDFDNRLFDLDQAAVCRETGRVFFDAVTWFDNIKVDWSFLRKRYPGNYVSWGSLTEPQKEAVRAVHGSLEGFQTAKSSRHPAPRMVEPEIAFERPGPLYVDWETKVLVGWKQVPETNFEILIVQKPIKKVA